MNILFKRISTKSSLHLQSSFQRVSIISMVDKFNFATKTRHFIKSSNSQNIINTRIKVLDVPEFGAPPKNKIKLKYRLQRVALKIKEEA